MVIAEQQAVMARLMSESRHYGASQRVIRKWVGAVRRVTDGR